LSGWLKACLPERHSLHGVIRAELEIAKANVGFVCLKPKSARPFSTLLRQLCAHIGRLAEVTALSKADVKSRG